MAPRKVTVFTPDLTQIIASSLTALRISELSKAAEKRILRNLRGEVETLLKNMLDEMRREGTFPRRSGGSFNAVRFGGIRVFGTTFVSLRAHLVGPANIRKLEEGATVTPTRAKKLAIPMPEALRTDGTPKLPGPRSWSNIKKTFIYTSKERKNKFIVYKGNDGDLVFLYALVDSAQFERGGFLERAWLSQKPAAMNAVASAISVEFGVAFANQTSGILHPKYSRRR